MILSSYKSIKQKYIDTINVTDLTEANGYSLSWGNINGYRAIYNWNNGVFDITDAKYDSGTYSEISSYIASNYGNKKDEFSTSDVIWYVYKRQSDGYDFSGWKDEDGNILTSDQIKNKAVIKNTTYTAGWTPKNDTKYTVEYYVQNLSDDGYSLYDTDWNPVTSDGTTDTLVVVSDYSNREITGFTYNEDKTAAYSREKEAGTVLESSLDSATIKGDGSLVIKLYYDRNSYTVRFLNYDGTILDEGSYKYGDMPSYTKTTPVRNSDDKRKVYLFNNWDKEIVAVTMDADYTAQYTEKTLIVDEDRTVDTAPSTDDAPSQPDNNGETTQTSASETSAAQTTSNSTVTISDQRIAMTDEPDVLGASRDASKDDAAVLGERRYSTGDYDYTYKYVIIIIAAGLIITQLYFGFGKKQSDK